MTTCGLEVAGELAITLEILEGVVYSDWVTIAAGTVELIVVKWMCSGMVLVYREWAACCGSATAKPSSERKLSWLGHVTSGLLHDARVIDSRFGRNPPSSLLL